MNGIKKWNFDKGHTLVDTLLETSPSRASAIDSHDEELENTNNFNKLQSLRQAAQNVNKRES